MRPATLIPRHLNLSISYKPTFIPITVGKMDLPDHAFSPCCKEGGNKGKWISIKVALKHGVIKYLSPLCFPGIKQKYCCCFPARLPSSSSRSAEVLWITQLLKELPFVSWFKRRRKMLICGRSAAASSLYHQCEGKMRPGSDGYLTVSEVFS